MRVGVAFQDTADSFRAGAESVREALAHAKLSACDLVLVFSTAGHDNESLRDGIRSVTGPATRLIGVDAVGALTNHRLGYGGYELGVAAFALDDVRCHVIAETGLADGEIAVGRALGRHLAALHDEPAMMLLYDSVNRTSERMTLNMATPLLHGIEAEAGVLRQLVGAGLCGDMTGSPTYQLVDDDVRQQTAIALAFSDEIRIDSTIIHGCQPASDYMTVTRADGATILEIDHRPAVEVIRELLGGAVPHGEMGFFVTLGINTGDKWAPFDESAYVNRLCLKVDRHRGGLIMFEPDLVAGTQVQLMHRNVKLDYIAPRVEAIFDRLQGRRPVLALYIDCAGRAAAYAGMEAEDAEVVQDVVADRVPLLGFYSGLEIGQVSGKPRPLNWTGIFCLFSMAQ